LVCAVALLFLALVPGAQATIRSATFPAPSGNMTFTPTSPVAGDTVTTDFGGGGECNGGITGNDPVDQFSYNLENSDGSTTKTSSGDESPTTSPVVYSHAVTTAGTYEVIVDFYCPQNVDPKDHFSYGYFTVAPSLGGTITTSPSPVVVNQPVTLSAMGDGGHGGYTYAWDLTNSGTYTAGSFDNTTTFTTTGSHTVNVKITDGVNYSDSNYTPHTAIVPLTFNVVAPTPGAPPPPPPPTCYPSVTSGLAYFSTTGCFTKSASNPNVYTTRSDVMLNGATLVGYGQTFTVTTTSDGSAGHFTAPNSTIQIGGKTVFSGNIDWTLPTGGAGSQALAESFTVSTGASFLNLTVSGTVSLTLGENSDGTFYSDYGLNLQLPAGFSAGPDPSFGSVSGGAAIKVEQSGAVDFGGIVLDAQNVWLGSLQVENACFAYVPANGNQGNNCPAVSATSSDAPIVTCNTNPDASYWAASITVDLPSGMRLGASGTIVGGTVGSFSGVAGNLGRTVPITAGFFLDHIAFGMCLNPPPLTIAANVGVNFLGSNHAVSIEGGFTYTDSTESTPWSVAINGAVSVGDTPIGTAEVGFDGNAVIDFEVQAGFTALDNAASLNGDVYGWIDAPEKEFVVGGDITGCLGSICAGASGEFSSTGVAGCVTIGTTSPTYDLIIPLDGGRVHLDTTVYPITAGFGYVWGNKFVDLLGGSCDFSSYEPADAFSARAAGGNTKLSTKIASGTEAVSLRIHGTHGAPQVVIHGPNGVTINSPSKGITNFSKGHYLLLENKSNSTADVMLIRPAAGTWTVSQAPHSKSSLTTMDRASLEVPPTFGAHVSSKGARRVLKVAYAVPVGATVRLQEHARGVEHVIAKSLKGQRCPGLPMMRPHTDERILCANVAFTPSLGLTRKRQIIAVVSKGAIPLFQKAIASFTAPALRLPSRPAVIRVQRGSGDLVVSFASSASASHYAVSARLTDGRQLSYYLGARCHALKIVKVPAAVGGTIKIAGVRYDLKLGKANTIGIKPDVKTSGKKSKKLKKGKVCS
jgi:hypothetical protein